MSTTHQPRKVLRYLWPFPVSNGKPVKPELAPRLPKREQAPKHQTPPGEDAPW